jgi:hypothetical protein
MGLADHQITFTEHQTTGKVRSLIVDGSHWVSMAEANTMASAARADERGKITAKVEADRADLSDKIKQGPEVHDWEQIDQWSSERVALNRVLTILKEG